MADIIAPAGIPLARQTPQEFRANPRGRHGDATAELGLAALAPGSAKDSPESIGRMASEFESLLIAGMLKSARESSANGGAEETDQGGSAALDMADEQIARVLAQNGGFGLARLITKGLTPKDAAGASAGLVTGSPPATAGKKALENPFPVE